MLQLGGELMSVRCTATMLCGLAAKMIAMAGPGRGLLLGSLVDMLLNNIHFMFKLFDFVSAEQWILFINT